MKPLIETTSLLYKRRLIRELNTEANGFYCHPTHSTMGVIRCTRATVSKEGIIRARNIDGWHPVAGPFTDPHGREIVATRKAGR